MYVWTVDQQTTTLIAQVITGAVALVAGLGAASLTAYINRRNTNDTLDATRRLSEEQWTRNQEHERHTWLRGRQQKTYADFLALVNSTLDLPDWGAPKRADEPTYIQINAALNRVALVGSPDGIKFANAIALCAMKQLTHIKKRRELELTNNPSGSPRSATRQWRTWTRTTNWLSNS
ncbi:hypothetical protein NtRootA4_32100 [Arthrobacter sp. NtRootA4]|nr:hypothetical protein NtRootA2_34300 [Arthrobacter sp. NtRootA2]BCW16231.1 hypothetical protein NtRootA4_32100 [Arthrobacter sp. NtRootA4]BCW24563.1 hypothetical protein NtRootC7_34300 [Arthrobacter sp. NtRootC7]BCW28833.1 hypothetical protein NtRootC45_34330 [Arthrobacter sp. NtRootC45]BCW33103.1 hypothetical protein NtRootD5_34340 [Arthrobacter sp. NtRootD5]